MIISFLIFERRNRFQMLGRTWQTNRGGQKCRQTDRHTHDGVTETFSNETMLNFSPTVCGLKKGKSDIFEILFVSLKYLFVWNGTKLWKSWTKTFLPRQQQQQQQEKVNLLISCNWSWIKVLLFCSTLFFNYPVNDSEIWQAFRYL